MFSCCLAGLGFGQTNPETSRVIQCDSTHCVSRVPLFPVGIFFNILSSRLGVVCDKPTIYHDLIAGWHFSRGRDVALKFSDVGGVCVPIIHNPMYVCLRTPAVGRFIFEES